MDNTTKEQLSDLLEGLWMIICIIALIVFIITHTSKQGWIDLLIYIGMFAVIVIFCASPILGTKKDDEFKK